MCDVDSHHVPDGVVAIVRVKPAGDRLAQHIAQGDLGSVGHLQRLPLSDSSQPALNRNKGLAFKTGSDVQQRDLFRLFLSMKKITHGC